ncbi:multiheme c-type cytochrome [Pikeienuella sp. HZG-20]|uniref:multiheme c-type cytochrome n=1 Tax=Paludibacillus litoralis TaxID=3133267 RepID=UPI0030ECAF30
MSWNAPINGVGADIRATKPMTFRIFILLALTSLSTAAAQDAPSYVGSAECADCHLEQAELWKTSHHDLAWTLPSDGTVVADFDGAVFQGGGLSVAFSRDESGHHAKVTERGGETTVRDVHSVVGIEPLQQYLFETEPGRLQSFDVVWDTDRKRWFHLYPDQDLPPDDGLHWTGPYKNWNARCAECHATGFEKNYDAEARHYQSTQAEIGVGCEACHGPGSAHLDWARTLEPPVPSGLDAYGFTMATEAGPEGWIQQCAGCHSRREAFNDGDPIPGTPYDDAYRLALLTPDLYFPDGQIKEEVYVYGSFLQSRMYAKGVSCMNCHDPHTAELVADGDAVCAQCHSPAGDPDFPSLPLKAFDSPAHHFHSEGSEGARCVNCHMTTQIYMGVDARRDHSFRIPRPDLTGKTGAPDACTTCHKDETPDWAAAKIADWYPESDKRGPHFGPVFAQAASDPAGAAPALLAIARDEDHADIVRATALHLMQPAATADIVAATAPFLEDESALARSSAVRLQRAGDPQRMAQMLVGMLTDPARPVRFDVAQALLAAPIAHMPDAMAADLNEAITDWRRSLSNRADFPETHLVLGGSALVARDFAAANEAFRKAVRLDPQLVDAWVMIIRIEAAFNGADAGRQAARLALQANPDAPALLALHRQLNQG